VATHHYQKLREKLQRLLDFSNMARLWKQGHLKKKKRYRLFFVKAENADLKARLESVEQLLSVQFFLNETKSKN